MISRRRSVLAATLYVLAPFLAFMMTAGCGSGKQAQVDMLSQENLRMKYQMDSIMAENRRYLQQLDALAMENRDLAAQAQDAEARLRKAQTPPPAPPPPAVAPVRDLTTGYAGALATYRTRDFRAAMLKFEQLLKEGISDELKDNCHYWIGECLYGMGKYSDAMHHFETVISFPRSEKKDDSMLMMGNANAAMGNRAAAKDWYNRLISSFPASPYVKKAKEKLAKLG